MFKNTLKLVVGFSILAGGVFAQAQEVRDVKKSVGSKADDAARGAALRGETTGVAREAKEFKTTADKSNTLRKDLKASEKAGFQYKASAKYVENKVDGNATVRADLEIAMKNGNVSANKDALEVLIKAAPEKAMSLANLINRLSPEIKTPADSKAFRALINSVAKAYAAEGPGATSFTADSLYADFNAYKNSAALNNFLGIMKKYVEISKTVIDIRLRKTKAEFGYLKDLGLSDKDANEKTKQIDDGNCFAAK